MPIIFVVKTGFYFDDFTLHNNYIAASSTNLHDQYKKNKTFLHNT